MIKFNQGDIIRIEGYDKQLFVIVSKNAFIKATGLFHVCPLLNASPGPVHISVCGRDNTEGTVICEQIKLIDTHSRSCRRVDSLAYDEIMNVSDAIQGLFEYD